ncbi:MAG: glycosyltransferase family 4 protein [Demequinaceae bacterium]|nr:glycosyltransferase family 4 protein [Demequinaceae bacterium]
MRASSVVIVSHTAQLGGGETALLRLLDAVDTGRFELRAVLFEQGELGERLERRGIPFEVVRLGELNTVTRHQAASPLAALSNGSRAMRFVPSLASAIKRHHPDLLVANTLKSASMLSLASPLLATPWVWHLHDRLAPDYLPRGAVAALRGMGAVMPRHVIVNSQATLQTLGRMGRARASVAYPGLDAAAFAIDGPRADSGAIGIVGRISETKGQLEFVQAASTVLTTHPDAQFRIIGAALFQDGGYEERIREAVSAAALSRRLEFAGWATDPGAAIRRLRLLVHASPVPEPFGQVVIEAMAAGVPVIATDAGGIPEILDPDGWTERIGDGVRRSSLGILARPGDPLALAAAISWALDNPASTALMADAARLSALERFSVEGTARVVESVWGRASKRSSAAAQLRRGSGPNASQRRIEG